MVESNITVGVACRLGNVELTQQLLHAGYGAFPDDRSWWPIHEAAYGLHLECCKVLIESGKISFFFCLDLLKISKAMICITPNGFLFVIVASNLFHF